MTHGIERRENKTMTKRVKSSKLVKARKETKRLQREAQTRIRKAKARAIRAGDKNALKQIAKYETKTFKDTLTPASKIMDVKNKNFQWEKGRQLRLKDLMKREAISHKRQKRNTKRTFETLFGKEKTKELLKTIGGSQMTQMSDEFWEEIGKAKDLLHSAGIPWESLEDEHGTKGSGLLVNTGRTMVQDGYWENVTIELGDSETSGYTTYTDIDVKENRRKIQSNELADTIVQWYKERYGLNSF